MSMQKFSPLAPYLRPTTLFSVADSGLLSPSARATVLRGNRGLCLNCHEYTHSFKHSRHSFTNASGCLNRELSQFGEDDAYQRWQARMTSYRRDSISFRPNNHKKNRPHRSGQSRAYRQDRGQVNGHNGVIHTRLTTMVASRPRPALLPPLLLLKCAMEPPTTRAETRPHASLIHSVLANDSSRQRYGTPGPSTNGTVGNTSFYFARCLCTCC